MCLGTENSGYTHNGFLFDEYMNDFEDYDRFDEQESHALNSDTDCISSPEWEPLDTDEDDHNVNSSQDLSCNTRGMLISTPSNCIHSSFT